MPSRFITPEARCSPIPGFRILGWKAYPRCDIWYRRRGGEEGEIQVCSREAARAEKVKPATKDNIPYKKQSRGECCFALDISSPNTGAR